MPIRLSRRCALVGAAATALSAQLPSAPARAAARPPARTTSRLDLLAPQIDPILWLSNVNTSEVLRVRFFQHGVYRKDAIEHLDWFFRDWREAISTRMDVRLFWGLAALGQAARLDGHDAPAMITSGYRTSRTNAGLEGAALHSLHRDGRAIDFLYEGLPTQQIARYAVWLQIGGVGHYPGRFVHIDSGPLRHWTR